MTYTIQNNYPISERKKTIFLMIAKKNGATLEELKNATGQSEIRIRSVISELRTIWSGFYTIHVQTIGATAYGNASDIRYTATHKMGV
jgi:hypothetical protein